MTAPLVVGNDIGGDAGNFVNLFIKKSLGGDVAKLGRKGGTRGRGQGDVASLLVFFVNPGR